jgi:hypothetical protein
MTLVIPGIRIPRTASLFFCTLLAACGPGQPGDDMGFEETQGDETAFTEASSESSGDGDSSTGDGDPVITCVELPVTSLSCWQLLSQDEWAQIMPTCGLQELIDGGILGDPYIQELEAWGEVTCHDVLSNDQTYCFYGPTQLILAKIGSESWDLERRDDIQDLPELEHPCP